MIDKPNRYPLPTMRILPGIALALLLSSTSAALQRSPGLPSAQALPSTLMPAGGPELWVSGYCSNSVHRFHPIRGGAEGMPLYAPGAQSVVTGPDGLLYVCAEEQNTVLRFDGTRPLGPFVSDDPGTLIDETGGLDGPTAAIFGADGNLYVGSFNSDAVLLYDGQTGAYMRHFITPRQNGLNGPDAGMIFGPDGHLYVPSFNNNRVLRYDGASGATIDVFVDQFVGGLRNPRVLLFRPNGNLWVSSWGSGAILAFDCNGDFVRRIIGLRGVTGFLVSPHDQLLYAASDQSNRVQTYNWYLGTRVGTLIPAGSNGLSGATFLAILRPRR